MIVAVVSVVDDAMEEMTGGVALVTVTVALADAVPPVQFIVYVVVTVGETVTDPDVPDPVNPEPEQDVVLTDDHVSVVDDPRTMDDAPAVRVTVGPFATNDRSFSML